MNALPLTLASLASQRVAAHGRLGVRFTEGRTRIAELYQEGAAKLRIPRQDGAGLEAVLINTAGGLTGGDRLSWRIAVGEGATLTVTTQACARIYRAAEGLAEVRSTATVGRNARLAWLPQETILFDRGALVRGLDIELADGAQALVAEAVIVGRKAHEETVSRATLRERWRVRQDGRLIHGEELALGPDIAAQLAARAGANGATAFATAMLVGEEAEALLEQAREIIGDSGGASFWRVGGTGKLLARLVAEDGYTLRQRLVPLLGMLNRGAVLPKLWSL
jgi:urease accessory protein